MPTADDLRALARSSPWLWTTLHLERHLPDACEAWITRPDRLVVVTPEGGRQRVRRPRRERRERGPVGVEPRRRDDGLVLDRPRPYMGYADVDLMWADYRWLAMLDPVELAVGVELSDVRSEVRRGRDTWWARARAVEGYDPRCSCCPLLWSAASDDLEYMSDSLQREPAVHPDAYDVGLDVQTGVVVSIEPVGVRVDRQRLDLTLVDVGPA